MESHLDEILHELHQFNKNLGIQVGGKSNTGTELIITAGANPEHFESAKQLVAAAPDLDNWTFIALIPPTEFDSMAFDNIIISLNDLSFSETLFCDMPMDDIAVTIKVKDHVYKLEYTLLKTAIHKILSIIVGEELYGYIVYIDIEEWDTSSTPNLTALQDFIIQKRIIQQEQANQNL